LNVALRSTVQNRSVLREAVIRDQIHLSRSDLNSGLAFRSPQSYVGARLCETHGLGPRKATALNEPLGSEKGLAVGNLRRQRDKGAKRDSGEKA
jgi:hypothetical protein